MAIKKNTVISFLMFIALTLNLHATKLPDDVWNYVKTNLPDAQARFDSVITLKNDIMYIPLYPPSNTMVDSIKIEYTYPINKTLKDLPEVILFNNGYSLLKVFKDSKGNYTLTQKDDLPIKVRLGLMPQDMLTPIGLKMPESLKLTLGDILIPSKEETSLVLKTDDNKTKTNSSQITKRNEFVPSVEFKNKKIFINPKNSKFLEVYDNKSINSLYELKLSSMPLKIITSKENNAALVLYWSSNDIEIINLKDENTLAKITLDAPASDVALNSKDNIAYVTSQNAKAIYVIDLNSMQLKKIIKLDQRPSKITYCELDNSIAFFDEFSSQIFNVTQNGSDFVVQPIDKIENVSKIITDIPNIYAISRTQSELYVYDKVQTKLINTITLDKKPTDAILYGTKIFILCSKEGYMDVYDTVEGKIIQREQLSKDGFYSKMNIIPNEKNIIITGLNTKNYLIYNLDLMKLTKKQESYIDVANIIFLDNSQRL